MQSYNGMISQNIAAPRPSNIIMLNLRKNKSILRPNTGNLIKHSNNISVKSASKDISSNFDDKLISKVIRDLSYSTNNDNDYCAGRQNVFISSLSV